MATRLNAELRNAIVRAAVEKSEVPKLKDAYGADLKKWIDEVWVLSLGGKRGLAAIEKAQQSYEELKAKIPPNVWAGYSLTKRTSMMNLNLAGMSLRLYFNGKLSKSYAESEKDEYRVSCGEFTIEGDHSLHGKFLALEIQKATYEELEEKIRGYVRAAVNSASTIEALVEQWPECVELVPAAVAPSKSIAVLPAELNTMIGLPSGKKRGAK